MKKIAFFLVALLPYALAACNSAGGENNSSGENKDGQVVQMTTESFQKLVWDYKKNPNDFIFNGDQPCIIDFYADWCRPCKMIAPILSELSSEYKGKIRVYKVNTDEQRELSVLFRISSIPAVLFVPKTGKPQMTVGAQQKNAYVNMIHDILGVK
jgi:thioredoxin 1